MTKEKTYPDNLYAYYRENPDRFEEKTNMVKKAVYFAILAMCVLLLIFPGLISNYTILIRILAVIGIIISGFAAFLGGSEHFNKKSGGKIKNIVVKKFDSYQVDEQLITDLFNSENFEDLAIAPSLDDQPVQLYIHEDKNGRIFFCQVMKYFSTSDFRGITEVKEITGDEYTRLYSIIYSMK